MGNGSKQGEVMVVGEAPNSFMPSQTQNPLTQIQNKVKEVQTGFNSWLSKQPIAVEAAVSTASGAVQGALMGAIMGTLTQDMSSSMPNMLPSQPGVDPSSIPSLMQAQALSAGPLVQARNFAVMTGVNVGISSVLKRLKGKEDVQSSMIAAFGSGAAFSLVSSPGVPNPVMNMVTSGIFFAAAQGALFKLGQNFSKPQQDDPLYMKTRSMLTNLGLQNYEKNFKKGLLNDYTLPLLNDSALKDVNIPPGPRLVILDHIERDPELRERRRR